MRDRVFDIDGRKMRVRTLGVSHQAKRWQLTIEGERGEHGERFSTLTHVRGCAHAMEDGEKRSPPSSPSQSACSSTACTGEHAGERPSSRSPNGAPPDWLKEVL
jgi:hypothetical protein